MDRSASADRRAAKNKVKKDRLGLLAMAKAIYEPRGFAPYMAKRRENLALVDVFFHLDENGRGTGPHNLECVTMSIEKLVENS